MEALVQLLPILLIVVVFWLLLIRPQRRRQLELLAVQRGITAGDEVMLGSGLFGRVVEAGDDEVLHLEVAPGVNVRVARGAVARVLTAEPPAAENRPDAGDEPGDLPGDRP